MGAGPDDLRRPGHLRHIVHLPAGEGGRHQHDAELDDQERIFINKFVYRFDFGNIERGDMVVFWFPGDPSKSYIKRVIGLPGDRMEVDDGKVIVNGQALVETYVPPSIAIRAPCRRMVPEDEYFVLGDHRSSSNDSRAWGMVPRRYIYGKAVFIYWPLDKMGLLH